VTKNNDGKEKRVFTKVSFLYCFNFIFHLASKFYLDLQKRKKRRELNVAKEENRKGGGEKMNLRVFLSIPMPFF